MTTKGNVKELIEKYNIINLTIEKSISPRGTTTNSLSFERGIDNNNNINNINNEIIKNQYDKNENLNNIYKNNNYYDLSPNMISSNSNQSCNSNNNSNGNSLSSSSSTTTTITTSNSNWVVIMPTLKINQILSSSSSSSSSIEDEHIQEQLKIQQFQLQQQEIQQKGSSSEDICSDSDSDSLPIKYSFCLSPRPILKKDDNINLDYSSPPPNLDKRRYSRDLIPLSIVI